MTAGDGDAARGSRQPPGSFSLCFVGKSGRLTDSGLRLPAAIGRRRTLRRVEAGSNDETMRTAMPAHWLLGTQEALAFGGGHRSPLPPDRGRPRKSGTPAAPQRSRRPRFAGCPACRLPRHLALMRTEDSANARTQVMRTLDAAASGVGCGRLLAVQPTGVS